MKNTLKQQLLYSLQKLNDPQTTQVAITECTKIFRESDQYQTIIQTLLEQNPNPKPQALREQIKMFGLLAQNAKCNLQPYLAQIITYMMKKLKDFDQNQSISVMVAETIGKVVQYAFTPQTNQLLGILLKPLLQHLSTQPQHALCLTRVVQFLPVEVLEQNAQYLLSKLIQLLQHGNGKVEILEGIAAVILSVEEQAEEFADQVVPILMPLLQHNTWQVKKMALDVLYSLSVLAPQRIQQYPKFKDIAQVLKTDKMKVVRDSALLVYGLYDEMPIEQDGSSTPPPRVISSCRNYSQSKQSIRTTRKERTNDEKLDIIVDAIDKLTILLQSKGLLDTIDLQPIVSMIGDLKQPNIEPITQQRSPIHSSCEMMVADRSPVKDCYTSRNIVSEYVLQFDRNEETFISKEAAEILREFKERQKSPCNDMLR